RGCPLDHAADPWCRRLQSHLERIRQTSHNGDNPSLPNTLRTLKKSVEVRERLLGIDRNSVGRFRQIWNCKRSIRRNYGCSCEVRKRHLRSKFDLYWLCRDSAVGKNLSRQID